MSQSVEYTTTVTPRCTLTMVDGKLHSINDQPAEIFANGSRLWYVDGKQHRDGDRPAAIYSDGSKFWYVNGKLHRDNDQPAIMYASGDQRWYVNGKQHRSGDQPAEINANGDKFWYVDGKKHRGGDQPAEIRINKVQRWYSNGKQHRDNDQPAEIYANGDQRWYFNGNYRDKPLAKIIDDSVSFVVNNYMVNYRNVDGIISQKINITDSGDTTVTYSLLFDGGIVRNYTIDIKVKDLNNITKMKVLGDNKWVIAAMVGNSWVTSTLY